MPRYCLFLTVFTLPNANLFYVVYLQEDEEDNFVLTAMIDAVEAGNLNGMKELLDTANHYDVNLTNKVCMVPHAAKSVLYS